MGFAGAYTAQSTDGSAIFHNAAGIAFLKDRQLYLGGTLISPSADFTGAEPLPGRDRHRGRRRRPPRSRPTRTTRIRFSDRVAFGDRRARAVRPADAVGEPGQLQRPLHLHAGRRSRASRSTRPSPSSSRTGSRSGVGLDVRFSSIALDRRVPVVNPFTQQVVDGASVHAGERNQHRLRVQPGRPGQAQRHLEHRPLVPAQGDDRLQRHRQLRATVDRQRGPRRARARVPAAGALPVATSIEFPALASFGFAKVFGDWTFEADVNWYQWNTFDPLHARRSRPTRGSTRRSRRTTRARSSTASAWSGC